MKNQELRARARLYDAARLYGSACLAQHSGAEAAAEERLLEAAVTWAKARPRRKPKGGYRDG